MLRRPMKSKGGCCNPSKEGFQIQAKKDFKSKQRRISNPNKEGFQIQAQKEIHAKETFEIHALPKVHQPKVHH